MGGAAAGIVADPASQPVAAPVSALLGAAQRPGALKLCICGGLGGEEICRRGGEGGKGSRDGDWEGAWLRRGAMRNGAVRWIGGPAVAAMQGATAASEAGDVDVDAADEEGDVVCRGYSVERV